MPESHRNTHALIEINDAARTLLVFRRIQGNPQEISRLLYHALKRRPDPRSTYELLISLGACPKGSFPEVIESPNDIPKDQLRDTARYVIDFTPHARIRYFPRASPKAFTFYGRVTEFIQLHPFAIETPSQRLRKERQAERQRKRRELRRASPLQRISRRHKVGEYLRPNDPNSRRYLGQAWEPTQGGYEFAHQWSRIGEPWETALARFEKMPKTRPGRKKAP